MFLRSWNPCRQVVASQLQVPDLDRFVLSLLPSREVLELILAKAQQNQGLGENLDPHLPIVFARLGLQCQGLFFCNLPFGPRPGASSVPGLSWQIQRLKALHPLGH